MPFSVRESSINIQQCSHLEIKSLGNLIEHREQGLNESTKGHSAKSHKHCHESTFSQLNGEY